MLSRRRLMTGASLLALAPRDSMAFLLRGGISSIDPLATLLASMSSGEWLQLNNQGTGTNVLPKLASTRANFDPSNVFATDAAVAAVVNFGNNNTAFGSAAIRASDGQVVYFGGGHVVSEDSSVYTFNVHNAAASINGGGTGAGWTVAVPGAQLSWGNSVFSPNTTQVVQSLTGIFTAGSPNVTTSVAPSYSATYGPWPKASGFINPGTTISSWSGTSMVMSQNALAGDGSTQIALTITDDYVAGNNVNGHAMPVAPHSYFSNVPLVGTTKWLLGGEFGNVTGQCQTNAVIIFDDSAGTVTLYDNGVEYGTAVFDESNNGPGTQNYCDLDGNAYTWSSFELYRWTNLQSSSCAKTGVVSSGAYTVANGDGPYCNLLIFPDPINGSTKRAAYAPASLNGSGHQGPCLFTDISGTPAFDVLSFTGGAPPLTAESVCCCWDSKRGLIIQWAGGQTLTSITPTNSSSGWTTGTLGTASGVTPTATSGTGFARIQYLPTWDCYIGVVGGNVYVRKP